MEQRTRIVPVELDDKTRVLVRAVVQGGEEDVAAIDRILPFTQVTSAIGSIAKTLNTAIAQAEPNKATIEFGIEVALEAGELSALIVQGNTSGNLKITLEWEKPKPPGETEKKTMSE